MATTPAPRCAHWQHRHWAALRRDLAADIERYLSKSAQNLALGRSRKRRWSAFLTPELQCLALHRLAHWLHCNAWQRLAGSVALVNTLLHKVQMPASACIGPGCRLSHPAGVVFDGSAGRGLTLFGMAVCCPNEQHLAPQPQHCPQLGDDVTLGAHAVVMGPVQLGHRIQVGPFARVVGNVPDDTNVVARAMLGQVRHTRR